MIVNKYGLSLHRLKECHLETLRLGRNSLGVQKAMFFQQHISPAMQREWFARIFNRFNCYFVVEHRGKMIGSISGKDGDYDKGVAEVGAFFWDERFVKTHIPMIACLVGLEVLFCLLDFKAALLRSRPDNSSALQFVRHLGCFLEEQDNKAGMILYRLEREAFLEKAAPLRRRMGRVFKDLAPLGWESVDFSKVTALERKALYTGLPQPLQAAIDARFAALAESAPQGKTHAA
ncbi:MAG: hypothetical protein QMD09_11295 [Desulfatibacillaceae bacterium]|nr:hypothetical protein [Desulfatibacillaceae bacterium]